METTLPTDADELCDEHCHVAHTATDVQHTHSRYDSGIPKEMLALQAPGTCLPDQSVLLDRSV